MTRCARLLGLLFALAASPALAGPRPAATAALTVLGMIDGNPAQILLQKDAQLLALFVREHRVELRAPDPTTRLVAVSSDGRLRVAAGPDGALRWQRVVDGRELLSAVVASNREWVIYTPSGYYEGSAKGAALVGWDLVLPSESAPRFFPLDQLDDRFHNEALVQKVLDQALTEDALSDLPLTLPVGEPPLHYLKPLLEVRQPGVNEVLTQRSLEVRYSASSLVGDRVQVKLIPPLTRAAAAPRLSSGSRSTSPEADEVVARVQTLRMEVPPANFTLVVEATTLGAKGEHLSTERKEIPLKWGAKHIEEAPVRLFLVAAGVSTYVHQAKLSSADKDARDIVALLKEQEGKRYSQVKVIGPAGEPELVGQPLVNEQATRSRILSALSRLADQKMNPEDLAVVFLAGHGLAPQGNFHFVPYDGDPASGLLANQELQEALARITGRTVLMLDTCFAGGALQGKDFGALLARGGASSVVVLASSTVTQTSGESAGQGYFTKAVLEGLKGKADADGLGQVTVAELMSYVSQSVKERTGAVQQPSLSIPSSVIDFDLTRVTRPCLKRFNCLGWSVIGAALFAGAIITGLVLRYKLPYDYGNTPWLVRVP